MSIKIIGNYSDNIDKSKFKEGDKVWCEYKLIKNEYGQLAPNWQNTFTVYIAHFPKEETKLPDTLPSKIESKTFFDDEIIKKINEIIEYLKANETKT